MGKPVALVGHAHTCPIHGGGPVMNPGQAFVRFNGIPLAVEGGQCGCPRVAAAARSDGEGLQHGKDQRAWRHAHRRQDRAWRQDRHGCSDVEIRLTSLGRMVTQMTERNDISGLLGFLGWEDV